MDSRPESVRGRRLAVAAALSGTRTQLDKLEKQKGAGTAGREIRKDPTPWRGRGHDFEKQVKAVKAFLFLPFLLFLLLFSFRILVGFLPRFLSGKPSNSCHRVSRAARLKLVRPIGG